MVIKRIKKRKNTWGCTSIGLKKDMCGDPPEFEVQRTARAPGGAFKNSAMFQSKLNIESKNAK